MIASVDRCDFAIGSYIDGKYRVVRSLGEGSYGHVWQVEDSQGQVCALKILKLWEVPPEIREKLVLRFDMEYATGQIKSPYLVQSLGKGWTGGNPYLLMEYCPQGDLCGSIKEQDMEQYLFHILYGLRRNFLGKPTQLMGTYGFMPAEQINPPTGDATVLPTTDIFSYGVLLYLLLTGELPFGKLQNQNDLAMYCGRVRKGEWNKNAVKNSPYYNVIEGCLKTDYKQRLQSIDEVLRLMPGVQPHTKTIGTELITKSITGYQLRIMQGEEYGKIYNLTSLWNHISSGFPTGDFTFAITIGRNDGVTRNWISVKETQSAYISRRHCQIINDGGAFKIFDGQGEASNWHPSTNGTYVNSEKVSRYGYYLAPGDIITIGDMKLRFEAY